MNTASGSNGGPVVVSGVGHHGLLWAARDGVQHCLVGGGAGVGAFVNGGTPSRGFLMPAGTPSNGHKDDGK